MKVYGDLRIDLQGLTVTQCIEKLDAARTPLWRRNLEMERDVASDSHDMYCFDFKPMADDVEVPAAHVWLVRDEDNSSIHVPNIIPIEKDELTITEYNAIRDRFFDDVVSRAIDGRLVHLSKVDVVADDVMSAETAKALKTFSAAANKASGGTHPFDQKRWFDFIIKCFRNGDRIGPEFVGKWLNEQGWDERHVAELRSEFEQGISLLRQNAAGG